MTLKDLNFILLGALAGILVSFFITYSAKADETKTNVDQAFFTKTHQGKGFVNSTQDVEGEVVEAEKVERELTEEEAKTFACTPENNCGGLSQEQEDCVVKKRCNGEIRKLLKKLRDLEDENEDLRAKNVVLESELDIQSELRRIKQIERVESRKNSVSLLAGRVGTGVKTRQEAGSFKAESKVENDLGLMYQRDFGGESRYRGSLGLTLRGAGYLGIGVNF